MYHLGLIVHLVVTVQKPSRDCQANGLNSTLYNLVAGSLIDINLPCKLCPFLIPLNQVRGLNIPSSGIVQTSDSLFQLIMEMYQKVLYFLTNNLTQLRLLHQIFHSFHCQQSKCNPAGLNLRVGDFFGNLLQKKVLLSLTRISPVDDQLVNMAMVCLTSAEDVLSQLQIKYD
ncbi:hypothetical protein Btru_070008 [Bulinus truncatus]|nr:hypothetical protein Btru_070008 [Bulinus truncatus]